MAQRCYAILQNRMGPVDECPKELADIKKTLLLKNGQGGCIRFFDIGRDQKRIFGKIGLDTPDNGIDKAAGNASPALIGMHAQQREISALNALRSDRDLF